MTRNNVKLWQKQIFLLIYDFFEEGDLFCIPEIVKLYEMIHHYAYSFYDHPLINKIIRRNNVRIIKEINENQEMKAHPQKHKLESLISISNELCVLYS
jgi:hypothetical protein